ncbi:MAG: hypothetical protein ACOZNI_36210 [Myxococcota bacterium]
MMLVLLALFAHAAEPQLPPPLRTSGGEVTLPWNDFETLYRKGMAPKEMPDPAAPRAWTLDRASYAGRVAGQGDEAHAVFKLTLRGEVLQKEGWVVVPLLSTSAALRSAKIGGQDAPVFLHDGYYQLVTNKPGAFTVEIEFAAPLFSGDGETGFSLPMAPSAATEATFTVESAEVLTFEVAGVKGYTTTRTGNSWRVDATLSSQGALAVSWQRSAKDTAKALATRLYAETHVLVGVSEGVMQGLATVNYTVLHKGVDKLRVQLPKDVTVLDVTGPGLRDWTQGEDGTIEATLNYEALGAYRLNVEYERALQPGKVDVPLPRVLDVTREKAWIGVDARSALELVAGQASGAVPVDVRELPAAIIGRTDYPVLLAWKARGGDVAIPLEVKSHPDVDMLVTLLDSAIADTLVTDDGRRMTRVRYAVRNNRNQFLRLTLPDKAEVWSASVAGRGVKVAKGEGGVLVPLVRSDAAGGALTAFLVEVIYVEGGGELADGKGELKVELPRVDAPTSQLQWSVYFPADAKVNEKSHEGTIQNVPYFSMSPQLPDSNVAVQAQQRVQQNAAANVDAGALGQGVEPVKVDLPLTGQVHFYEKMLVLDEALWVSFEYKRKDK